MVGWDGRDGVVVVCLGYFCSALSVSNSRGGEEGGDGFIGGQVVGKLVSGSYKIDAHGGMKGMNIGAKRHANLVKNTYVEPGR